MKEEEWKETNWLDNIKPVKNLNNDRWGSIGVVKKNIY